jgi:hypothetical protein
MINITEDTGQKLGQHELKNQRMKELGATVRRSKLLIGDYMLTSGGTVSVDTKKDMSEMYCNIIQDHVRLTNEMKLARDCNIKLIFLIEHGGSIKSIDDVPNWKNPQVGKHKIIVRSILLKHGLIAKFSTLDIEDLMMLAKRNDVKIPKPPVPSAQLATAMKTLEERYGCEFLFCKKEDTGRRIIEILGGESVD